MPPDFLKGESMKIKRYRAGSEVRAVITDKAIPGEAVVLHDGDIVYRDAAGLYHTVKIRGMAIVTPDPLTFAAKPLLILAHGIAVGLKKV
jgi:hypothetical protein